MTLTRLALLASLTLACSRSSAPPPRGELPADAGPPFAISPSVRESCTKVLVDAIDFECTRALPTLPDGTPRPADMSPEQCIELWKAGVGLPGTVDEHCRQLERCTDMATEACRLGYLPGGDRRGDHSMLRCVQSWHDEHCKPRWTGAREARREALTRGAAAP